MPGPFHSQTNEAWFVHTPGLKVVYPSTPEMPKVVALYRGLRGEVPERLYLVPLENPGWFTQGKKLTYGLGVK